MAPRSVIALVFALLVASCGGGTATTTAPNTTASTSNTTSAATSGSWSRVVDGTGALGGAGYQESHDLVMGPTGLVAVGSEHIADRVNGAVWMVSDDGTWSRVADPSGALDETSLRTVVAGGPGLVAAGFTASDDHDTDAAIFLSTDGSVWERVTDQTGVFGGTSTQSIHEVVVGGPGLVAVGTDWSSGDSDAAIWVSSDGSEWERVDDPSLSLPGHQALVGVITTADGLVAVGSDDSGGDHDAAVWVSSDGLTWTQIDHASLGGPGLQRMVGIAAAGPGLVAVGAAAAEDPTEGLDAAIWVSEDGSAWERLTAPSFGGAGDQAIQDIAASGTGAIAVGHEFFADTGDFDAVVWESPDGVSWDRVADPVFGGAEWQILQAVAIANGQVLATGISGSEEEADAAVWMRTQPN